MSWSSYIAEDILPKSTQYEPMHPSPLATASTHAQYIPMKSTTPIGRDNKLVRS